MTSRTLMFVVFALYDSKEVILAIARKKSVEGILSSSGNKRSLI